MAENRTRGFHLSERSRKRLLRIAAIANILVWIVLIFFVISGLLSLLRNVLVVDQMMGGPKGYLEWIRQDPMTAFNQVLGTLNNILTGIVYAVVLKGVSVGLNIIAEISMNLEERAAPATAEGGENE